MEACRRAGWDTVEEEVVVVAGDITAVGTLDSVLEVEEEEGVEVGSFPFLIFWLVWGGY